MVITNRELAAGTTLVGKYRGKQHTVLVLGDHETGLGYELDNETIYKSLSAAGSAVMNGVSCGRCGSRRAAPKARPAGSAAPA